MPSTKTLADITKLANALGVRHITGQYSIQSQDCLDVHKFNFIHHSNNAPVLTLHFDKIPSGGYKLPYRLFANHPCVVK